MMSRRSNTQEFIEKARGVHGERFDYAHATYQQAHSKVKIVCPTHGAFWQTPHNHLHGNGCPQCGNEGIGNAKRSNTAEFIGKAGSTHGNAYDYSKVNYTTNSTKVEIVCKTHGSFWQTPAKHLRGQGCAACGREATTAGRRSNTQEFIRKARGVHGTRYNYSHVEYRGSTTKVEIICSAHGAFWQIPVGHLSGAGCSLCAIEVTGDAKRSNTQAFIKKARGVHGDRYDYTKVDYHRSGTKVLITCPRHGSFWQTPNSHLNGRGCPQCAAEHKAQRYFKDVPTTLYVVQFTPDVVKVGITTKSVEERFNHEKTKPKVLYEKHFEDGLVAFLHEQMLLDQTATYKATLEQAAGILYRDGGITELRSIKALPEITTYMLNKNKERRTT